jgi:hypothetical protein
MKHNDKVKAIKFLKPNAEFNLIGDDLEWLDANEIQPTDAEIETAWIAYQETEKTKAKTKAQAKADLLNRLGITEDEAKLLLA